MKLKPIFTCPGCGATNTIGPFYLHACGYDKRQELNDYNQDVITEAEKNYQAMASRVPEEEKQA